MPAFSENFNGGVAGNTILDAEVAYDEFIGTAPVYRTSPLEGLAAEFDAAGGQGQMRNYLTTNQTQRTLSRYLQIDAGTHTANNAVLIRCRDVAGGANRGEIVLRAAGTLGLREVLTLRTESTHVLEAGRLYRLHWTIDGTSQTLEIRDGANDTLIETLTAAFAAGGFDAIYEGYVNNPTGTVKMLYDYAVDELGVTTIPPYSAGGVSVAETFTDAAGLTDSVAVEVTKAVDVTDPVGLADSTAADKSQTREVTDTLALADAATPAATSAHEVTNTLGIADATERAAAATRTISDPLGLTDAPAATQDSQRAVTDPVGLLDGTTTQAAGTEALEAGSPVGLADNTEQAAATERAAADTVGLADSVTVDLIQAVGITDTVGLVDDGGAGVQSLLLASREVTDSLGLTDLPGISGSRALELTDAVGVADSAAAGRTVSLEVTDGLGATDSTAASRGVLTEITDPIGVADPTADTATLLREITDLLALASSLTQGGTATPAGGALTRTTHDLRWRSRPGHAHAVTSSPAHAGAALTTTGAT